MNSQSFDQMVAPYRRELAAHCYRMLGSLADAEDQVQETLLSAWRGIDGFEGRSSLRSWLYKIATNRCLDAIRARPRRGLPSEQGAPGDPRAPLEPGGGELLWVDPCPGELSDATPPSPEAVFAARESVQLAFVVALQHLPATQRAVLILREVVGWSAAETAELLDTSVASVNSALQRARATLDARRDRPGPTEAPDADLLARYARCFERGDLDALVALLHQDVLISMPPHPTWFRGVESVRAFLAPRIGQPGVQRVVPVACADPGTFGFYRSDRGSPAHVGYLIQVIRVAGGKITEIHAFLDRSLFARFGLPAQLA